nr:hypothetical protein Ef18B006LT_11410 [Escherichia fergusonii]
MEDIITLGKLLASFKISKGPAIERIDIETEIKSTEILLGIVLLYNV